MIANKNLNKFKSIIKAFIFIHYLQQHSFLNIKTSFIKNKNYLRNKKLKTQLNIKHIENKIKAISIKYKNSSLFKQIVDKLYKKYYINHYSDKIAYKPYIIINHKNLFLYDFLIYSCNFFKSSHNQIFNDLIYQSNAYQDNDNIKNKIMISCSSQINNDNSKNITKKLLTWIISYINNINYIEQENVIICLNKIIQSIEKHKKHFPKEFFNKKLNLDNHNFLLDKFLFSSSSANTFLNFYASNQKMFNLIDNKNFFHNVIALILYEKKQAWPIEIEKNFIFNDSDFEFNLLNNLIVVKNNNEANLKNKI